MLLWDEDVVWAVDVADGMSALLLNRPQQLLYLPGMAVNRASACYRGMGQPMPRCHWPSAPEPVRTFNGSYHLDGEGGQAVGSGGPVVGAGGNDEITVEGGPAGHYDNTQTRNGVGVQDQGGAGSDAIAVNSSDATRAFGTVVADGGSVEGGGALGTLLDGPDAINLGVPIPNAASGFNGGTVRCNGGDYTVHVHQAVNDGLLHGDAGADTITVDEENYANGQVDGASGNDRLTVRGDNMSTADGNTGTDTCHVGDGNPPLCEIIT